MKKPWEIRPELQSDRLDVVAATIANARDEVAQLRLSENGDNPWAHGCRAYTWTGTALEKLSTSMPWLYAKMDMNIFNGRIEDLPFTVSRDDPEELSIRTKDKVSRLPNHENNEQRDFGFDHVWSDSQVRFVFAVDSTAEEVFGVSCLGILKNGTVVARYDANILGEIRSLVDIDPPDDSAHEAPEFNPSFKHDEDNSENIVNDNENAGEQSEQGDVKGESP